jgi:phosphatidylserine/phosphatidylglycerophosphate/cardiolipin synthase-like enzyme
MPIDGKAAEKKLCYLYSHAHKDIKIVIYSFTNSRLARALKKAASKGVKIYIIADKKESRQKYSKIPYLAAIRNIYIKLISGKRFKNGKKGKMHVKMSIIDNKYLIIGSANYSYSAFFKNYEYLIIDTEKNLIKEFEWFFNYLNKKAIPYKFSR